KNGPIRILCGKSQFSRREKLSGWKEDYESPKKKSIEDELNKWKIQIRLEQDKGNPTLCYLNEGDVEFENILNVVALGKELIVIDLFSLNKTLTFFEELNNSFYQ
ncbi:hypothetical protein RFI_38625, partial [Reticulomyxa filosa]